MSPLGFANTVGYFLISCICVHVCVRGIDFTQIDGRAYFLEDIYGIGARPHEPTTPTDGKQCVRGCVLVCVCVVLCNLPHYSPQSHVLSYVLHMFRGSSLCRRARCFLTFSG